LTGYRLRINAVTPTQTHPWYIPPLITSTPLPENTTHEHGRPKETPNEDFSNPGNAFICNRPMGRGADKRELDSKPHQRSGGDLKMSSKRFYPFSEESDLLDAIEIIMVYLIQLLELMEINNVSSRLIPEDVAEQLLAALNEI